MCRYSTAPTIITSPNPASRVWRGRCAPPSRSTRAPPTRYRPPRGLWAGKATFSRDARIDARVIVMPIYTVHQPRLRKYETAPNPERFAFVRDGFSFWAFLFGPLWMLRHRMWLVLIGYAIVAAMLFGGLRWAGASGVSTF